MENLTYESWMLIGLVVFFIITSIAMSIHIMKKYPPEPIPSDNDSEIESIPDDVMEDD